MPGMLALGASLELLASLANEFGRDAIARRVVAVAEAAGERLREAGAQVVSDRNADRASGIVSFAVPGQDAELLRRRAIEAGIALSCRAGRLRISPHAYNDAGDIERLAALLKSGRGA